MNRPVTARLVLLDAQQRRLDPCARGVGIGLFDGAFERQFNPGPPAYDRADPILNEAAEARNFVGSDSRRFYVRLRDERPDQPGTLPDGRRFVLAEWYTRDETRQLLDDNRGASQITLVEEKPGEFCSKALMLVTWEQDRDLAPHCGILGRYAPGEERRGYGYSDHRLRLASMFGDMVVACPAGSELLVAPTFLPPERKRLPVCLFVASRCGLEQPVTTPEEVFGVSLGRARRIYSSVGIAVETARHPVAETLLEAHDPRIERVGGANQRDSYYLVDLPALLGRRGHCDPLEPDGFAAFCRFFPELGRTIRVLYAARFPDAKFAFACPVSDFEGRAEAGACACQAERYPDRALMAHEVGHILTDKSSRYGTIADQTNGFPQSGGHFSRPAYPPDNRFIHFYNLMGGSRYRLYDVDVTEAPPGAEPRTFNQYRDLRRSPYIR